MCNTRHIQLKAAALPAMKLGNQDKYKPNAPNLLT